MKSATATVEIGPNGRCTIPVEARRKLGIDGEKTIVEMDIRSDCDDK